MSLWGWRLRSRGLWPQLPQNALQRLDTGAEEVAIGPHDVVQFPDQRCGLFVCEFKVHSRDIGALKGREMDDRELIATKSPRNLLFSGIYSAPRLPGTSGPAASKSAMGSSTPHSRVGQSNASRSEAEIKKSVGRHRQEPVDVFASTGRSRLRRTRYHRMSGGLPGRDLVTSNKHRFCNAR